MIKTAKPPRRRSKEWWEDEPSDHSLFRYRRLWALSVMSTCLVALIPLLALFTINYVQYERLFKAEVKHPIHLTASNRGRALEDYLRKRLAALNFIVNELGHERLSDETRLDGVFDNLRESFTGFVDLGVIDADGIQKAYVGPYPLQGKDYSGQDWFAQTMLNDVYVCDVYMGYRRVPHFALAVRGELPDKTPYVLRATMNADTFAERTKDPGQRPGLDAFVINTAGVLQTPSKEHGKVLSATSFPVPPPSEETVVQEVNDADGRALVVGYKYLEGSPFIFVAVQPSERLLSGWYGLRTKLVWFLAGSVVLIVIVILAGAGYMVRRVREADDRRLALLHKMEYTAKMASIGRLASGVAHEINNPLAIINEKAGLLHDFITFGEDFPRKEQFLRHIEPITNSVERCARITRRLLRFAKDIDVSIKEIDVQTLLREVLGFLERESTYRNISIEFHVATEVPQIHSDAGRLQQVFLNIFNNAIGAVEDGGHIDVSVTRQTTRYVRVAIRDDGSGIDADTLKHIFEPFYTTNKKHGTGLGLSITYGIVSKLGGSISVDSEEGAWSEFTVVLPVKPDTIGDSNGRA